MADTDAIQALHWREAALLIEEARQDLSRKGYRPGLIGHALKRAESQALNMSERVSAEIRGRVFVDFVRHELHHCETWCRGVRASLNEAS